MLKRLPLASTLTLTCTTTIIISYHMDFLILLERRGPLNSCETLLILNKGQSTRIPYHTIDMKNQILKLDFFLEKEYQSNSQEKSTTWVHECMYCYKWYGDKACDCFHHMGSINNFIEIGLYHRSKYCS